MLYLTGNVCGEKWKRRFEETPELGMLLNSDGGWITPRTWSPHWALDNGAFTHSEIGPRPEPDWWERKGEALWLNTLPKMAGRRKPLFVALPDVVCNWPATIERAFRYRATVEATGCTPALVLQNGFTWEDVAAFGPRVEHTPTSGKQGDRRIA